jgi:pimeloyl-ACP methyl ester carboxylesterase
MMFLAGFDDHRKSVTTTPTADVSYVDVGAGPPTLFVHGLATNAYVWQNLIGHLSDIRRRVAVDLPLHGQSPARTEHERAADPTPHIRRRWRAQ